MDSPEEDSQSIGESSSTPQIYLVAFPNLDRLLVVDVRDNPELRPGAAVLSSRELATDFADDLGREMRDLFTNFPILMFSRLRVFAYMDNKMAELTLRVALKRLNRAPADLGKGQAASFARIRGNAGPFFQSQEWKAMEEKACSQTPGDSLWLLQDELTQAKASLLAREKEIVSEIAEEERQRLISGEGYYIIRPPNPQ